MSVRVLPLCALVAAGCAAGRASAWSAPPEPPGSASDQIVADLVADGNRAWQRRAEPLQLEAAARAYAAALRYRPSDPNVLEHLGRVALRRAAPLGGRAAAANYDEATRFAERALAARNPALAAAARAGKPPDRVFARAQPADTPALALYAEALLGWAITRGTAAVLEQRAWIAAAAQRAAAYDASAGWGAPNRVLGVLACELPEARQNLRDALERFEAALAAAPAYLPTRIAYAEAYAARVRDDQLYHRLIDEVLAADPRAIPEAVPENLDAQRIARSLIRPRP